MTADGTSDTRAGHSGAFRFRLATHADLPYCAELLPAGFRADASVRRRLIELWRRLLASDSRCFAVFEDLEQPFPASIVGFGLSVFLTDRFVAEFCASPRPYVAALVYERLLAGEDVVMTPELLRVANSTTGLNSLALHHGMRNEDLSNPRTAQLMVASNAAFFFTHGGYRINSLIAEVYGPQQFRYLETGGFRLIRDFRRESPASFESMPPAHYPYLFMLRRDWVEPIPINPLSQMFSSPPPLRLHFSPAERRVLERALLNEPDIAASLGVSSDTIKKTWRSIYERVSRHAQYLIPASDLNMSGSRGQEKRRYLLDYLRTHLEELRPVTLASRSRHIVSVASRPRTVRQDER